MKIRDLICTGCSILTLVLLIILSLDKEIPVFIVTIPLLIIVVCALLDVFTAGEDGKSWFDKKIKL
jgi:hypothetical protein